MKVWKRALLVLAIVVAVVTIGIIGMSQYKSSRIEAERTEVRKRSEKTRKNVDGRKAKHGPKFMAEMHRRLNEVLAERGTDGIDPQRREEEMKRFKAAQMVLVSRRHEVKKAQAALTNATDDASRKKALEDLQNAQDAEGAAQDDLEKAMPTFQK
jgi:hypothetical protein